MRYRTNDLPTRGLGAFTPLASVNPIASSWGTVVRMSTLGVTPIPSPHPAATPDPSFDPHTVPSGCSPDVFFPSIYVTTADHMGPEADTGIGMTIRRRCPLPVPAVRIAYAAMSAYRSRKIGGRAQVQNPRAFQRFPQRSKAVNNV